jgi:hypothetical protein
VHVHLCRVYYVLALAAAVLVGTTGQQLLAGAVTGLLVIRRVAINHAGRPVARPVARRLVSPTVSPVHHP